LRATNDLIVAGKIDVVETAITTNMETMQEDSAAAARHQAAQAAVVVPLLQLTPQQQELKTIGVKLCYDLLGVVYQERQEISSQMTSVMEAERDAKAAATATADACAAAGLAANGAEKNDLADRCVRLQQQEALTNRLTLLLHKEVRGCDKGASAPYKRSACVVQVCMLVLHIPAIPPPPKACYLTVSSQIICCVEHTHFFCRSMPGFASLCTSRLHVRPILHAFVTAFATREANQRHSTLIGPASHCLSSLCLKSGLETNARRLPVNVPTCQHIAAVLEGTSTRCSRVLAPPTIDKGLLHGLSS
jgi:hypothetical protein